MERAETGEGSEAPITVLCVDGDGSLAEGLEGSGRIEATGVNTLDEAVDHLAAGGVDCLVCDHETGGTDVLAFLQAVRADSPDLPFVFAPREGSERIASEAISAGVTDYRERSTDTEGNDELARRIETAVAKRRAEGEPDTDRARRVLETAPDPVLVAVDGEVVFANAAAEELLSPSRQELSSVFGPTAETLLSVGSARDGEGLVTTRASIGTDGRSIPVDVTAKRIDWGGSTGVVCVCRRVEDQPQEGAGSDGSQLGGVSETTADTAQEEAMFEHMTESVCGVDEQGQVSFLNESFSELLGRDREKLLGRRVWDALPDRAGEALETRCREATESREPVSFEVHSESLGRDLRVRIYPSETGLTVYLRDVSNKRRVEAELRETAEKLGSLYQIASDQDSSFEEKRRRILGVGTEYLGLPYGFVSEIGEDTQRIIESVGSHELLQPGESCPLEESYCRKTVERESGLLAVQDAVAAGWEGDLAYETFELGTYIGAKLLVDGELYGTLCFAATEPRERSFTDSERTFVEVMAGWLSYEYDQHNYRRRLEAQNERLEQFASMVSHDLRNPLNVAVSHLELVESESDHLGEIDRALERMETLIEDILLLARQGDGVGERTDLNLGAVARAAWEGVATEDASLSVVDERVVNADESRLKQLFENLFRNSVKHGGEEVTVTVGELEDGFYVEDDGPGIPESEREQVFEQGYSGDPGGTGLGLSIVGEIAAAHGWEITAGESDSGGARFEIRGLEEGW